jgi:DNA-binding CsgD family transcriptional regulator
LRAAEGDLDAAADAAEHALIEGKAAGLPFEHARSLLTAGRIRRRRKEKTQARNVLLDAQRRFADMGATLWAAQTAAESQRLGLRGSRPGTLTATEQKIAEMVSGGLTNREIAGALFVSEKTVEANLSRVFRKLNIRSRRELRGTETGSTTGGGR